MGAQLHEDAFEGYPTMNNTKRFESITLTMTSTHTHAPPLVGDLFDSIMGFEPTGPLAGKITYTATATTNTAMPKLTFSPHLNQIVQRGPPASGKPNFT